MFFVARGTDDASCVTYTLSRICKGLICYSKTSQTKHVVCVTVRSVSKRSFKTDSLYRFENLYSQRKFTYVIFDDKDVVK